MGRQSFGAQVYETMRMYEDMALVASDMATRIGASSSSKFKSHIQSYLYTRFAAQVHEVLLTGARRRSCLSPLCEAITREREAVASWVTTTPLGAPRPDTTNASSERWSYEALLLREFEDRLYTLAAPTGKTRRRTKKRPTPPTQGVPSKPDAWHEN